MKTPRYIKSSSYREARRSDWDETPAETALGVALFLAVIVLLTALWWLFS